MLSNEDMRRASDLLADPDAEDCERFASRYGHRLLDAAALLGELVQAAQALAVIGNGYCVCSQNRDPDKERHEPECADLRAALLKAEAA